MSEGLNPVARAANTNPPPAADRATGAWDSVQHVALRMLKSPLFWTASSACVAITATLFHALPLAAFGLACAVTFFFLFNGAVTAEMKLIAYRTYAWGRGYPWVASITPNLFIGGLPLANAGHLEEMRRRGITHVVNMTMPYEARMSGIFHEPISEAALDAAEIQHRRFALPVGYLMNEQMCNEALAYIQRAIQGGGRVYLHDLVGDGRCVSLAEMYLISMRIQDSEYDAFNQIQQRYPLASRNDNQRLVTTAYALHMHAPL